MKRIILLFLFFILIGLKVFSQSCPNSVIYDSTNHIVCSGDTIQLNCEMPYVILSPKVFAPGASNNYIVESIPYSPPCPYNISPTAIEYFLPSDDIWGSIMDLNFGQPVTVPQFKFSFYGQNNLTQCVVGSNGLLSWNLNVASFYCIWNFEYQNPIPNSGFIYKNCIYGPYHDIDFAAVDGIGNMYFEISGTYPCRKIVLSFDNVPMYRCNEMRAYHMMVLYETTNTIEFYMQNKPICPNWNEGRAILGIQNAAGTQATVVSNYNLPNQWSATNQAWRIRPQGNLSSYTNWYKRSINGGQRTSVPSNSSNLITANPTPQEGSQWYIMETKIVRLDSIELTFLDSCIVKPYNPGEFLLTHNGDTSYYDTICKGSNIIVQFRGGNNYRMISPIVQEIVDTNSTILTPLFDNTYIFEANNLYENGQVVCSKIDSFHVHVNSPNLELGGNKEICRAEEVKLWNINGVTTDNYEWYYNVNNVISNADTLIISPESTGYLFLKQTDDFNCFTIDSVLININEPTEFNIIGTTTLCEGMSTQLTIDSPLSNCSYLWNTNQTTPSISVNPNVNTWYNVKVENNSNCISYDSIQVIVNNNNSSTIQSEICQGETYNQYGFNETQGGFYTQSLQTINGCDSIINLNLQVNQKFNDTIEAEICIGNTYSLYGFNETQEGFYTQSLQTIKGCDSIVNLKLLINTISIVTITAEICQGQTYNQYGFNEIHGGYYTHSFQNTKGCDSIINLNLQVNPIYRDTIIAATCQGETYNQYGFNETQGGFYTQSLQTINGCDSIINLNLQVNQKFNDTIEAEICIGNTYSLNGFNETQEGFYTLSLQTIKGCDSIVNLKLLINPISIDTITAEICQGQTYNQYGFNEIHGGYYTHSFQTTKGCDSIINLNLQVNPIYRDTIIAAICQGETYNQYGFNETQGGFYTQSLQTINGCDSIINLNLQVNQKYNDTIEAEICIGNTYSLYGFNETQEGFYTLSLQTTKGCDSIVNLKLLINPISIDTITAEICQGQTYNQYGFNEIHGGYYTHSFQTTKGCDSIVNLCLQINPIYNDTIVAYNCKGEIYNQYGFNETLEGFYTHFFQTIKGCDSIINLNLIYSDYSDTIQAEICQGQIYNQYGFNETQGGFYTQRLQTINSCDSIYYLNLQVNPIYIDTIEAEICQGNSYSLYGFNETNNGFYSQNLQTTKGCDSIINLRLKVNPIYNDTIRVEICQGETYDLYGFHESLEGFYTQNFQTIKGCDSIINLNLINPDFIDTIKAEICEGETYNENGFNETQEGFYTKTLQTVKGCDSIVNLNLHINPKYNISLNQTICEGKSYTLNGFNESNAGNYTQHLLTYKGCDSIINLELLVIETPTNYSLIEDKYVIAEDFPIIVDVSCENCFNYLWNTGARDSIYNINHIGNYYVSIEHVCGMIFDSLIVVYPEVNVFLPNAFTPNENSNNTFFPIFESTEKVFIESFEIYNRWGTIIYSSKNKGWDGRYNGKLCDSGVYVWRLLYKTKYTGNNIFEKTGDVNLIR